MLPLQGGLNVASIAQPIGRAPDDTELRERRLLRNMAVLILSIVVAGFGGWFLAGFSSFHSPWWVHIHAISFVSWVALFTAQNLLVVRNRLETHRTLGRLGAFLAAWMILVGLVLTPVTIAVHRNPPVLPAAEFLAMDWANILIFGVLTFVAIAAARRGRSDWHRRLILCAMVCVINPAVGRLEALAGVKGARYDVPVLMAVLVIAMVGDSRIRGRVHQAYYWGFTALCVFELAVIFLPGFQPLAHYATRLAAR